MLCFIHGLGWERIAGTREQFKVAGPECSRQDERRTWTMISVKGETQVEEFLF